MHARLLASAGWSEQEYRDGVQQEAVQQEQEYRDGVQQEYRDGLQRGRGEGKASPAAHPD